MTPSNPILHTSRLYSLFSEWHKGIIYKSVPLFYEDWDDQSSRLLLACDTEVQDICHALYGFDLQEIDDENYFKQNFFDIKKFFIKIFLNYLILN